MDEFQGSDFDGEAGPLSPVLVKKRSGGEPELGSLCSIKIARQAPRTSNQRAHMRRPAADEETIVRFRDRNLRVELVNLSSGGAMIESDIEPFIGEAVQIQIGDGLPVPAVARWVGGGRVGVEFGSHSLLVSPPRADFTFGLGEAPEEEEEEEEADEPAPPVIGAPAQPEEESGTREPRQAVIRRAMVRAGIKRVPVRLCNISSHGVMLESDHCLKPGSAVQLEMAGGVLVTAEVRWSKGKRAGLSFDAEVNTKGLGSMNVPPPAMVKPTYLESEFDPNSPWAARFDRLTMRALSEEPPEAA
jgi:hypothetical protein